MGQKQLIHICLILLMAGEAGAVTTPLYFRINSGVRTLSTTAPTEPALCSGFTGCDQIAPGGAFICSGGSRQTPSNPIITYTYVTPSAWSKDVSKSDTKFSYFASNYDGVSFTQPKIKVTYKYNNATQDTFSELMGTPCPCTGPPRPQGCDLDNTIQLTEFNKNTGINIANYSVVGGSLTQLATILPAGSTIMVEVWVAEGQGTAAFYASTTKPSNIDIPYAPNNFAVYGSISPKYVQNYAGAPVTMTYRLKTDISAPSVSRLDITIPGNILSTTQYFGAVSITSVSRPLATTSVQQISYVPGSATSYDGKITVDFSASPVPPNSIVDVIFTADAPVSPIHSVLWKASVQTTLGPYNLSEEAVDDQYMAVLPVPATPTGVAVTPVNTTGGGGQLQVTWPVSGAVDTYSTAAVSRYEVWRGGSLLASCPPSGSGSMNQSVWKPVTWYVSQTPQPLFVDTGLTNTNTYCYQIKAFNTVTSGPLSVSVCGVPYAAAVPPVSLTARAANGAMGLTWTPSVPGSYPLSGYQVWRSSCSTCPSRFSASVWGDTASSFLDSSLSNGALYTYTVKGFDDHWYQGALGPADNGYPAANPPTNLSALYDFAGGGMALSWTLSPGHKNEHAIVGYNIYRSTCGTCPWNFLVGPPTVGSSSSVYLDMAVTPASVCRYMLTTTTMETEGPLTPAVRGMVPPATPSALTVLSQPSATLFLEWSSNNTVGRVNGYKIYRTTVSGNMWQTASRTPQSATSYLDTATTFGQRYYYRVSAWCQNGADWAESLPTPEFYREVEPSHLALLDIDPWDAEARLSWVDLRMDQVVSNYRIYRSTQALLASTVFVGAVSTTQFTGWLYFNDSTVTNGITYNYWVAGDNEGGEGDLTPFAPITPYKPPQAPSFLSAMSGVNRVELTWSLTLVGTYGIQGYEVLWSKAPGAATMPQGMYTLGPSASTYSHTGLVNGTPYFYAVRAFDFNGNRGAASVEATVAPAVPPCAPTVMGAVSGTGWVETEWGIVNSSLCAPPGSFPIGGYYLYKSTSMGGGYVSATRLYGSAATAYFDSEVTQGQTYYYRVWTYDDQVPPNQTDEFFTGAAPIVQATPRIPAGAPGGLIIDYSSPFEHDGRLKLSWVASVPGTLPVIGYRIYRSTDDEAAATSTLFVSGAATETVLDTGLTNGIYYHYHVAAVDEKWQDGLVSAVSGTAFRDPLVPVGVTSFAGNTAIFVNWTAPAAQTTFPIGGYFIYRATYSGIVGAGVALAGAVPVGTSWFTDSAPPLVNGQAYYYHLKTYDDRGNASYAFSLETSTVPFAPPQAPTGLSLFSGPSRVSLSWDAPAPGTFPVSGYLVFRASYAEVPCGLNPVQKVVGVQTWVDHGVTNGLDYYYSVAAYDTVAPWHFGPCSATEMVTAGAVDPPSVPGGLSGTTGSMRVTLSWLASTMGTLPLSGYSVYRTTFTPNPADPLSPYDTTTSATAGAYSDLAATDGAVYYYRVRARDDSGVLSNYSNELRRMASTPPSGLAGDVSVANQVSVSWNFLADPSALSADARPVSGYVVYRSTVSAAAGYVELTRTMTCPADPAATSYIDATAIRGLPMYYRVSALYGDDMWEGTWSAPISATAVGPPSQPGLAASLTLTGALLSWVPAFSSISPVTSYGVYRATTAGVIDGDTTRTAFVVGGLSYADAGVVNGTFYYYQVAAYDKNTTSTYSDEVAVLPLGRPLALSAFPVDGAVKLAWTLPTGGTTGIDGYLVYRYTLSEGEVESGSVYSGSASVLTDSTPINGISYTYRVQAFAGDPVPAHWSLSSNSVQATPASPPTAPNNPGAVASSGLVTVCWTTPTSLGTNPLSGYRLYRATGPGNGYSALATVSQSTFCYSDMAVTNASSAVWQVYYYRIAAFDTGVPPVEGPPSNIVQGVPYYNPDPPLVLTTIPGNGTVRLVWVAPADTTYPATKYNIYRGVFAGAESAVAINALPTAATIYTDSGRTNGQRYFYKVRTLDSAGHLSVTSMEVSCIPFNPPSTPAAMTAHPGNGVVMLAWADSTAGTYPFAGYKIYRGSYPGGATTFVASVSGLKYVDMAGISATDYYYSVRGYDSQGHESVVLEVSASPNTTLVNPPFNVAAVPASAVITVSWTWTTNGSAPGGPITEYAILKGTCASCPLTSSAYVSSTVMQWSDTGMSNGSVVRYVVRAVNAAMLESGDYDGFNSVSAVSPFQAPTAPRNLVATGGMGVVELKWDAPINPGTQPITGYVVLRNSPACPCSVTLATLSSPTAVAYQDNSVVNGTAYQYQVVPLIWLAGSYWRGAAATSQVVTPNLRPNESFISANAFAPARGDRLDITFTLDRKSDVKVGIYTITGIKVWETTMNSVPAGPALGSYLVVGPDGMPGWDGKAGDGLTVSSGVYILRIETAGWKKALKVIVIK